MKFTIQKLGSIEDAVIEPRKLTAIIGPNNSGKTYVAYMIYGFLKGWRRNIEFGITTKNIQDLIDTGHYRIHIKEIENKLSGILSDVSKDYSNNIHNIFNPTTIIMQSLVFQHSVSYGTNKPDDSFPGSFGPMRVRRRYQSNGVAVCLAAGS